MKPTQDVKLTHSLIPLIVSFSVIAITNNGHITLKDQTDFLKSLTTTIEELGYHKHEPKKIYNPVTKNYYLVQPIIPDPYLEGIMKHD